MKTVTAGGQNASCNISNDFVEEDRVAALLKKTAGSDAVAANQCMKGYTSMRVGGKVDYLVEVAGEAALVELLRLLSYEKLPWTVLGNGSNVIVADEGYSGVVLHIGKAFSEIHASVDGLYAGSGSSLAAVAAEAMACSLGGLEFASGIPGSLGGAIAMNAGAYGREMKDVVTTTRCLDNDGNAVLLHGSDHEFSYRHSAVQDRNLVVVSSILSLEKKDPALIRREMKELAAKRVDKQPLNQPSSGSTFKRPSGYFSGQLIEECGLKGLSVGGAQVSQKHAGFIVNTGNASATDVVELVKMVREKVYAETGVLLEPEVKLLKGDRVCNF